MRPVFTLTQDEVRLSGRLPARARSVEVPTSLPPHDHVFYEVCFVVEGRVRHRTAEGAHEVCAGDVVVVPLGGVHAFVDPVNCRVINLYYLADWLLPELGEWWRETALVHHFFAAHLFAASGFRRVRAARLAKNTARAVQLGLEEVLREEARPEPSALFLKVAVLKLMMEISRGLEASAADTPPLTRRPEVMLAVREVEAVLGGAAGAVEFVPTAIARVAGVSPDQLTRLFRRELGLSLSAYFQQRRVQRAGQLLLDPSNSISDIAHELGFADVPHFHRTFRRFTGLPPRRYRVVHGLGLDATVSAAGD